MGMATAADLMEQIGTIMAATAAVAFVLSLGRDGSFAPGSRSRLAGLLVASILFLAHALLARSVAVGAFPASADPALLAWVVEHRSAVPSWWFIWVSRVGGTIGMAVLATVAAGLFWWRNRRWAAAGLIGAAVGAALLVVVFKNIYGRSRPPLVTQLVPQSTLSLPSGHALGSIAVIGMLALLVGSELRSPGLRSLVAVLSVSAVAMIGASRLYLGVHWLSDVLAGWFLGGAWLALCAVATLARPRRIRGRRSNGPDGGERADDARPGLLSSRVVPGPPDDHVTNVTKESF